MTLPPRKRPWSRPLADLVGGTLDPVLARQGFSQSDLILNWDDIVGERLAAHSRPIKLQWPPRVPGRQPDGPAPTATLLIRVESGFALDLQHMTEIIVARINSHFGWRCVGKLVFRQGEIERTLERPARPAPPSPALVAAAETRVTDINDDALRAALVRLGAQVLR